MILAIVLGISLVNLIVMLNIKKVMDFLGAEVIQIIGKIAGILLTALAMQMIVSGLTDGLKHLQVLS